jgi:hypothetical protein
VTVDTALLKRCIPFRVIAAGCYMLCIALLYFDASRDQLEKADYAIVPGNTVHRDGTFTVLTYDKTGIVLTRSETKSGRNFWNSFSNSWYIDS